MNKYKEALKKIVETSCPEKVYCDECNFSWLCNKKTKEWVDDLRELVEKETPKMVDGISNGHIPKHGKCPNCGCFVVHTCDSARCVVCGQKLKWDDDE